MTLPNFAGPLRSLSRSFAEQPQMLFVLKKANH